jgi:hypothetical protein
VDAENAVVSETRRVVVHHTTTRVWHRRGRTHTTTTRWTESARVAVTVTAAYAPDDAAPDRPAVPSFRKGGALDGPNLVGSRERVARELLAADGGVEAIARRVTNSDDNTLVRNQTVTARRPAGLQCWVAADLRGLRRTVANVSVNVSRQRVAAGEADIPALLAERLRNRREALVDAPERYDGAADRARVAARAAYLDRVIAALEARSEAANRRNEDYRDRVGDGAVRRLAKLVSVGSGGSAGEPGQRAALNQRESDGAPRIVPDASPAYLTLTAVDRNHVPTVGSDGTVHPLTAETTNWFAMPYGDAAREITGTLFGGKRVSLETAAGTLVAANRTAAGAGAGGSPERSTSLGKNRAELTAAVARSVARVEQSVCDTARGAAELPPRACRQAVGDLRGRWPGVGRRGLAMSNGSYAGAFADALMAHGVEPATAEDIGVRVAVHLREVTAERRTGVPRDTTNRTATATRRLVRNEFESRTKDALERAGDRAKKRLGGASRLPTGLPLAPPPYTWVATVNAWSVTIRGEYQRFALRTPAGTPDGAGGMVRYVRDGSTVRLDIDGDGETERLGENERIGFETETTVVAAVPAGPPGVGDVDGTRTERSPGWPCPGADDREACEAARDAE